MGNHPYFNNQSESKIASRMGYKNRYLKHLWKEIMIGEWENRVFSSKSNPEVSYNSEIEVPSVNECSLDQHSIPEENGSLIIRTKYIRQDTEIDRDHIN